MPDQTYRDTEWRRILRLQLDDEEPWLPVEPAPSPTRSQTLILLAFLVIAAIAVVMWTQR